MTFSKPKDSLLVSEKYYKTFLIQRIRTNVILICKFPLYTNNLQGSLLLFLMGSVSI